MNRITRIVGRFAPGYTACYAKHMLPSHRRALADIADCRTPSMGAHLYRCNRCGKDHTVYHSCRNRSCPQCHAALTTKWIAKRKTELLTTGYFHLVFTVPVELRRLMRSHQRTLLAVLFKAASRSLMQLAKDPKYIGAQIGILALLHTWSRAMIYHPHIHCLVPGGGYDPVKRSWHASHPRYFVPVRALSILFRGKFMAYAQKELPDVRFPAEVWDKPWVVYSKPALYGASNLLTYLGRYVRRMAISESRIVNSDGRNVTFRYFDNRKKVNRCMTLDGFEFLRRYLSHVLPKGFHKVRYYGILAPAVRHRLKNLQSMLEDTASKKLPTACEKIKPPVVKTTGMPACPYCKTGMLFLMAVVFRPYRAPPAAKNIFNHDNRILK